MRNTVCKIILSVITSCTVSCIIIGSRTVEPAYASNGTDTIPAVLTVGDNTPGVTYLHEMLANLGYLPVVFHPISTEELVYPNGPGTPSAGTWSWRYSNTPQAVQSLWNPTEFTELTKGAVMTFQLEHRLSVDGFAGPEVFRMLAVAQFIGTGCTHPYTQVYVNESLPQTISVWQVGKIVFSSPCSTGVPAAATHEGTHVIYLRNRKQTMEGETPSGAHYRVEGVPYVSFFYRGEAIHGYQRQEYGFPQSVGCVELPIEQAGQIWRLTDYGTLVTIGKSQVSKDK